MSTAFTTPAAPAHLPGGERRTPGEPAVPPALGRVHGRHGTRRIDGLLLTVTLAAMVLVMADTIAATVITPLLLADPLPGMSGAMTDLQWLSAVYAAPVAALLTVTGRLADLAGRRLVLAGGLTLFAAASMVFALAPSWLVLLAARAGQGIGLAAVIPASLALLLADAVPERRGRAIALWSTASSVGAIIGHLGGGWLAHAHGWRATAVPGAVLAVVLLAAIGLLPDRGTTTTRRLPDVLGAALLGSGLGLLVLAISKGAAWGWTSSRTGGCVLLAATLLTWVAVRSRHHPVPIVERSLWRVPGLRWGWTLSTLYGAVGVPILFCAPLYVRDAGLDLARLSLYLVPLSAAMAIASWLAGRLTRRLNRRWPGYGALAGALLVATGCLALVALTPHPTPVSLAWLIVIGAGLGLMAACSSMLGALGAPPEHYASAAGAGMTGRMAGGAVGVAAASIVLERPILSGEYGGYLTLLTGVYGIASLAAVGTLMWLMSNGRASTPAPAAITQRAGADQRLGGGPDAHNLDEPLPPLPRRTRWPISGPREAQRLRPAGPRLAPPPAALALPAPTPEEAVLPERSSLRPAGPPPYGLPTGQHLGQNGAPYGAAGDAPRPRRHEGTPTHPVAPAPAAADPLISVEAADNWPWPATGDPAPHRPLRGIEPVTEPLARIPAPAWPDLQAGSPIPPTRRQG
ncbi:MFS transporter [Nonomuraea sp. NPDC050663]|uniref:MFS transporter n=1 Tax=Nonomuraea sp. NPDC050663 TaxID=3364370 RepID=UPI00379F54CC